MKFQLLDVNHPFFVPVWRRVAIVAFCFGWAGFEFAYASPAWGGLVGLLGIYCVWQLFFVFRPPEERTEAEEGKD
jgi:hypothetical protein